MGKHDEAWMILKQVHDTNMRAKGTPEKVFTVSVLASTNKALCHCVVLWNINVVERKVFI